MKKINGSKILVAVGLGVFAIATWFASRPPSAPSLPLATLAMQTSSIPVAAVTPPAKKITVSITSPTSGARWMIGVENTISWSKAAGVTGRIYLVNAASGAVAGWIQQNIAPAQTYFPWNTRELFVSETDPSGKDVMPGRYVIEVSFSSPNIPTAISAPFSIIAAQAE